GLALAAAASVIIVLLLSQFFRRAPLPQGRPPARGTPVRTSTTRPDPWQSLVSQTVAARRVQPPEYLHELRRTPDELRESCSATAMTCSSASSTPAPAFRKKRRRSSPPTTTPIRTTRPRSS